MEQNQIREYMVGIYGISTKIQFLRGSNVTLKCGVTANAAALSILTLISDNNGSCMTELVKKSGLTKGAMSQMANKLLAAGLIEKTKKADNAKSIYLSLTPLGKLATEEYMVIHDRLYGGIESILMEYPEDKQKSILEFLSNVNELIGEYKDMLDMKQVL